MLPIAILAGGLGTRLQPVIGDVPKCLVEVAGKPFVEHQLELLGRNGFEQVVLCLGHLGDSVHRRLGTGGRFGMQLKYVFDGPQLLGTGGALKRALPLLGDAFFVLYGDTYLDIDYLAVQSTFHKSQKKGLMTVLLNMGRWDTSNVLLQNSQIISYSKHRPFPEMQHVDYGL